MDAPLILAAGWKFMRKGKTGSTLRQVAPGSVLFQHHNWDLLFAMDGGF